MNSSRNASTLTSKHQITIPSEVRRSLNLHKGDRLSFQIAEDGSCVVRKVALKKSDGAAKGFLTSDRQALSDAKIQEAVKKGALASYRRRES